MNKKNKVKAGLEVSYYTCSAYKNGIPYTHKFSVLLLNFKYSQYKFRVNLN